MTRLSLSDPAAPLRVVRPHPLCAESPLSALQQPITPADRVYVRSNFDTPVAHSGWALQVGGLTPRTYSLAELAAMPQHEVTVTMECAGNWRLAMDPVPTGEPWQDGAVSTTTWSGVPLSLLLAHAGVPTDTVEVLAVGADAGARDDAEGAVRFERSLPLSAAMHPDTLVATHMAGVPLTPDHGAPLRLIVPGWYGMASVKWLVALEPLRTPFTGYFQQQRYVYDTGGVPEPVRTARVKSLIVSPAPGDTCDARDVVRGWAWSGDGAITRVEVAVNGQWYHAELGVPDSPHAWTPFSLAVTLPTGEVTLSSRATDSSGAVQPERIVWNRLGYGNNAVRSQRVTVR